jgi:hypothetical protein
VLRAFVVAAIGLVVIPLAAAAAGPPLTAPQYRAKADSICRAAKRRLDAVPNPARVGGNPNDPSALAPYLRAGIKIEQGELGQLETLRPPRSLSTLVTRGLANKRNQVAIVSKLLTRANAGKLTFNEMLAGLLKLPDGSAIWTKVGVRSCQY